MKRIFQPQINTKLYASTGKELQEVTNQAFEKFRPKSYLEKWNPSLKTLKPLLLVVQGFAVFLAGYFVASFFYSQMEMGSLIKVLLSIRFGIRSEHLAGLGILAASILLFVKLEKTKAKTLFAYLYEIFTEGKAFGNLLLIPVLLLSGASIFTTVQGGKSGGFDLVEERKERNPEAERDVFSLDSDSEYLRLVEEKKGLEKDLKRQKEMTGEYKERTYSYPLKSPYGKTTRHPHKKLVNLRTKTTNKIESLDKQIIERKGQIQKDREDTYTSAMGFNAQEEKRFINETTQNKAFGLGISFSLEAGILLLLYFIARIESRISAENRTEFKIEDNYTSKESYELRGFEEIRPGAPDQAGLPIDLEPYPVGNRTANRAIKPVSKSIDLSASTRKPGNTSGKELEALRSKNQALEKELESLKTSTVKNGTHGNRATPKYIDGKGFLITCQHCKNQEYMKSPKAKFCSTTCRQKAYTKRTGKSLHRSIKS